MLGIAEQPILKTLEERSIYFGWDFLKNGMLPNILKTNSSCFITGKHLTHIYCVLLC